MHATLARFTRFSRVAFIVGIIGCGSTPPPPKEPTGPTAAPTGDSEYDRLCTGVAPEHRAKCPIGAWAQSADDVEGGVLLHLNASAPPPDETQKRMRCHRAWMAHDPSNAMPRCPLGSPGITITATSGGAGTDLSLIASKPEDVQEVRRRTHAALGK
jgi:hypothetical protein